MLELIQIKKKGDTFTLNTVYINPDHIVHISEHVEYSLALREGKINLGLNPVTTFANIAVNEGDSSTRFIVVGDPSLIESKLYKSLGRRKILRG